MAIPELHGEVEPEFALRETCRGLRVLHFVLQLTKTTSALTCKRAAAS